MFSELVSAARWCFGLAHHATEAVQSSLLQSDGSSIFSLPTDTRSTASTLHGGLWY